MAKYRVLEKSFIGDAIVEAGAIVDYDGEPSSNLEPIKKARKGDDPAPDTPDPSLV